MLKKFIGLEETALIGESLDAVEGMGGVAIKVEKKTRDTNPLVSLVSFFTDQPFPIKVLVL